MLQMLNLGSGYFKAVVPVSIEAHPAEEKVDWDGLTHPVPKTGSDEQGSQDMVVKGYLSAIMSYFIDTSWNCQLVK